MTPTSASVRRTSGASRSDPEPAGRTVVRRARRVWVEAARPRTLPLAVAPVLVGTAAAGRLDLLRAGLALVVALALQVAVNYTNDYADGVRGVDTAARTGPRRAVAAGLVAPVAMRAAALGALAVAAVAGLTLAWLVGWELLLVGAACLLAALGYSAGPRPYASAGLGELAVFVFFGLVATVGSAYVQIAAIPAQAVVAAVPVGLLAAAVLVVNNLRDLATDAAAGKVTLAVRLGDRGTRLLYTGLVAGALAAVPLVALAAARPWPLLGLGGVVLALRPLDVVATASRPAALVAALAGTVATALLTAGLLTVGLALA